MPDLILCFTPDQLLRIAIIIFSSTAFVCSVIAGFSCDFLTIDVTTPGSSSVSEASLGLWRYQKAENLCKPWPQDLIDSFDATAERAFACVVVVMGGIGIIIVYFAQSMHFGKKAYKALGCWLLMTTLFCGLMFLIFSRDYCNDNNCKISREGNLNIGACCCWFCSSVLCCLWTKEPSEHKEVDSDDEEQGSYENEGDE